MHTQEEQESKMLELNDDLQKLFKNKSFKAIILDGYLDTGSIKLTDNLSKVKPEHKEFLVEELMARSLFRNFLGNIEEDARSILEARAM
jgi:chromatin remodeling complex protein RSC6